MRSSVPEPEEPWSELLGSTVFVRSKSPENESSRGMKDGPKVSVFNGFNAVVEARTDVSAGAEVAPGSGSIGAIPDLKAAGMI